MFFNNQKNKMEKQIADDFKKAIDKGYENLTNEEKIEISNKILQTFPQITQDPLYGDYKGDFSEAVLSGEFYQRYLDIIKLLDGVLNTVVYQTQHDQFRIGLEKIFDT